MTAEKEKSMIRKLAVGQFDDPLHQRQDIFRLDPYRSNIAVFGAPMSGKTTFLKTLLVRLHEDMEQTPRENIYLIDFGGNIGAYGKLRNVCACFDNSNEENIKRVFRTVEKRLEENARKLDSRNYYAVVSKNPAEAPTHLFLIIDNISAFLADDRYASYQERLLRFCRDGLSKGLTVVITANETTGLGRMLSNFGQKIAFEMPGDSYYEIFGTKVARPMRLPGRGVINDGVDTHEFQCFLPFPARDDEEFIEALVARTAGYPNDQIMAAFGDDLTWENFEQHCAKGKACRTDGDHAVVGLDYYEHAPVAVDLAESRTIAIYGKRKFGKTNLLTLLLEGIRERYPDALYLFFDDGREELKDFYAPGKYHISDRAEYFRDAVELRTYLTENGYITVRQGPMSQQPAEARKTPFTVFVMQSRMLFRASGDGPYILKNLLLSDAKARDMLLIFPDVPNITDHDTQQIFKDNIAAAFLLDNIGDFMANRMDKTAFGCMDAQELKEEYAKCSLGDGYFYDVEADKLQKLKFVKRYVKEGGYEG